MSTFRATIGKSELYKSTKFVYNLRTMKKNITLTADEAIVQQARRRAVAESTTLNALFRGWLERYVQQPVASDRYTVIMEHLDHVQAGRAFTRDELNERR